MADWTFYVGATAILVALVFSVMAYIQPTKLGFQAQNGQLVMYDPSTKIKVTLIRGGPGSNGASMDSPHIRVSQDDSTVGTEMWMQAWAPGSAGATGTQSLVVVNPVSLDKPWMPGNSASSNYLGYLQMQDGAQQQ